MEKKLTLKEREVLQKKLAAEAEKYAQEHGIPLKYALREMAVNRKQDFQTAMPSWQEHDVWTWQEKIADSVLSLAVVIQQWGSEKYSVSIGIDAAVQAASAYCTDTSREGGLDSLTLDHDGKLVPATPLDSRHLPSKGKVG